METESDRSVAGRCFLLATTGGIGTALCWMPLGIAPLLPLALLPAVRALRRARTPRQAVICGVLFGGVFWAVAAHFFYALLRFSVLAVILYLFVVAYILPFSALAFWGAFKLERRFAFPRALGLAVCYPWLEKARTLGDASFPPDVLSHAFGTYTSWLAWTPWTGPFGVSLMAFGVAAILDIALESRARPRRATILTLVGIAVWLAPPLTDRILHPRSGDGGSEIRVGIVQPSVAVTEKLDPKVWPDLWRRLVELTLQAAPGADLIVWPETARPGVLKWNGRDVLASDPEMQALADRAGVPILYGCEIARVEDGAVTALYNGAALVHPGGTGSAWYGKQQLLPFVEGVPFASLIGWDPAKRWKRSKQRSGLSLAGNFYKGPRPTVFEVGQARIGVLVCFESQYPWLGRTYRRNGANLLLHITNDAWWGRSIFARWHAEMVGSQARSLDVPVIHAANSGISCARDRFGKMSGQTGLFEVTTLRTTVRPSSSPGTFYARHGNVVPGIALVLMILYVLASWVRQARGAR